MSRSRIFLLSPAHCGGERAKLLFRPEARFELAMKLRTPQGAMIGQPTQRGPRFGEGLLDMFDVTGF